MSGVIITGCNGLLGTKLASLVPDGREIIGIDIHGEPAAPNGLFAYESCDINDQGRIADIFDRFRPDAVMHTAAFTHVDGCETERQRAWDVNVKGTEHIAESAKVHSARLIHLSTDYVFDGRNGPYREEDTSNPISHYGYTKLASEQAVNRIMDNAVIARTMVLYGIEPHIRKNFLTWLLGKLTAGEPVTIVTDQYGNPTLADDLAGVLWALLDSGVRGIYHTAGRDWLNRFEFARAAAKCFGMDPGLIQPTTTERFNPPAPRPLKSGLICEKLKRDLGISMCSVSEGLETVKRQMESL